MIASFVGSQLKKWMKLKWKASSFAVPPMLLRCSFATPSLFCPFYIAFSEDGAKEERRNLGRVVG